jgi:hypothetical protein
MTRKFKYNTEEDCSTSEFEDNDDLEGCIYDDEIISEDNFHENEIATPITESSIDGDYELEKYDDNYQPFKNAKKNHKKPIQIVGECSPSLQDIFNSMSKMTIFKIPKKFNIRSSHVYTSENVSSKPSVKKTKLCRSLLNNKCCLFGASCKFAHNYSQISKCNYDHCKKIQLIGNGFFKNINDNSICRLRHNLEMLDSFILRTNEITVFDLSIEIFSEFVQDVLNLIKKNVKNVIQITVI